MILNQNRKIFKFYKYLIRYRENGNPCRLLKYINPLEAQLIDSSFKAHIRFRLGGVNNIIIYTYIIIIKKFFFFFENIKLLLYIVFFPSSNLL